MKTTVSILTSGLLVRSAIAETIHGVTVFTRHGDRTSKHYSGYRLTNLGVTENFEVGSDYRDLYIASGAPKQILGISESTYVPSQIFASAPDQQVLLNTATAFMQGLYPPLSDIDGAGDLTVQSLNNGSSYESPLNGYQYVVLHGEESTAPDTIWIKGDEGCPASTKAQSSFEETPEYLATVESTRSFYEGFWDVLQNVYDYSEGNLTYDNAYDIYDLVNVASIHNASLASNITASELFQLRTLADSYEWGHNYNASQSARSTGGQTLAGGILSQLNQTITSKGKLKFSLLAGSYDNFMAFFGIMNLTSASPDFYGLPSYASTMAFELFTESNLTAFPETTEELSIRFLFRNGSDAGAPLQAFPLFGGEATSLPWETFSSEVKKRAITSVGQWCNACNATQSFCPASSEDLASAEGSSTSKSGNGGMSNAVAGVIGAMVTLAVALLVALAYFLLARRKRSAISAQPSLAKVESEHS